MLLLFVTAGLIGVQPQSIVHDLRVAVAHETIGSKHFRKVLAAVLEEDGASEIEEGNDLVTTLGDARGCVVRTTIEGANKGDLPIRLCLFFWPKSGMTQVQLLQRAVVGNEDFFLFGETYWSGDRLVMCGPANSGGNFDEGWIRSYRFSGGAWRLKQSLELDSGVGPYFKQHGGSTDPNHIVAPVRFRHQEVQNLGWYPETDFYRVTYRNGKYMIGPHVRVPSPLTTIDDLLEAAKGDDGEFARLTNPSIRKVAKKFLAPLNHVYVRTPDNQPYWSLQLPRLDVQDYMEDLRYRMSYRKAKSRYILVAMNPLPKRVR